MTDPILDTIHVVVVKEATTGIAGLASGTYDVLDSQTGVQAQYEDLSEPDNEYNSKCITALEYNSKVITALEYGWQELSYNHYDARWGMNAHDPRELYPDDYTGDGAPLDPVGIFLGIFALAGFGLMRKRK
jgi:hypothetical protein